MGIHRETFNLTSDFGSTDTIPVVTMGVTDDMDDLLRPEEQMTAPHLLGNFKVARNRAQRHGAKALVTFGAHPRELVTGEVALGFLKEWCAKPAGSLIVLPVLNRWGRDQVMFDGELCLRNSKEGFDINRDFPITSETEGALATREAQLVSRLLDRWSPQVYVDVHSGSEFVGYPPGSAVLTQVADTDANPMQTVALKFKKETPVGPITSMLGYDASGNAVDYAYMRDGAMAFAVEVYAEPQPVKSRAASLVTWRDMRAPPRNPRPELKEQCFQTFNPVTAAAVQGVVSKWSALLRSLVQQGLVRE